VKSLDSQLARGRRASSRFAVLPVDVEPAADRASFSTVHPDTEDVWLYLVDPNGAVADPTPSDVDHVESPSPHEFVVDRPQPGRWLLVAVRPRPSSWCQPGADACSRS
jgi:hypothetical protein